MANTATTKPKNFRILISVVIIVAIAILLVTLRPWSDRAAAELKTGTTDGGRVTFIDDSTGEEVDIQVVDDDSGAPVDGIEVTYFDGEGYEVFITHDASDQYLPAIGIYEHNSDHVIETKKTEHGSYQIFAFEDEGTQTAAWEWEHDNHMDWSYYEYVKTIDYEEKMEMQKLLGKINDFLFDGILYFFAVSSPISPSELVEYLCPEPENPPQRWDIYDRTGTYYADSFAVVPSNIPEVEITSLTVGDNEVSIAWTGSDKDHYEVRVDLPSNKDLTKYVDGNDTFDLEYSYRITSDGQVYSGYDWTHYSSDTSVQVEITESGSYRFELRVKDEVENVGSTSRDFEVETTDIEEPPDELSLTISSATGGSVTTPGEGAFIYDAGTEVDLVATPDSGYRFVNWIGDTDTVADVNAASTTVTINDDYAVLANFEEAELVQSQYASLVAAGDWHTVGRKSNGTVVAVGWNIIGQCSVDDWTDIIQVAAGSSHTVGLKSNGTVVAVGRSDHGECNVGGWTGIVQVAAGNWHTVGLKSNGTVVAVGYNSDGQCKVNSWTDIIHVAAAGFFTVGVKSDGTVVAVGSNFCGQCEVNGWTDIIQVAAGGGHTVGLRFNGTVVAVGDNYAETCEVGGWTDITQVAAGTHRTVGLKSNGTVVAVGHNKWGQCNVDGWTGIIQVAAGSQHTVGLKSNGTVVAVGDNEYGECDVGGWDLS